MVCRTQNPRCILWWTQPGRLFRAWSFISEEHSITATVKFLSPDANSGAVNTSVARMYWDILSNVIFDLADLHVRCVLSTSRDSEVFLEQRITTEAKSLYESQSPAWIPERWLLNSIAYAVAWMRANLEISVLNPLSLSHTTWSSFQRVSTPLIIFLTSSSSEYPSLCLCEIH